MNNEKTQKSRRKLLKLLAASGGVVSANLPLTWRRPLISSIIVPAHAQVSGVCYVGQQSDPPLRECICISGNHVSVQVIAGVGDSLFTGSGTVAQLAAGIPLSPPSAAGIIILDGVIVGGTSIKGHLTVPGESFPYTASQTGSCALQGVTYSLNCGITSATDGDGGTDIDFTFTIFRDGQTDTASGRTMNVEFTFSPSGSICTLNQEFTLSSGTFSGVRSINCPGADNQSSVSMMVDADFGLAQAGVSCNAGPTSIGGGGG